MLLDPELHYLDNAATTMVDPEIAGAIHEALLKDWANPSSLYEPAVETHEALTTARGQIARTLGCQAKDLYFTSCGSESNNMALLGAALTRRFGKGIVVSGFEHPSVQKPLERLAAMGYDVTVVDPGPDGTLDIDRMLDHVDKNTILVACMMVNNEVGTRNDVERLAAEVKRRNSRTIVHVDAVQAWMRVPIKLANIDTLAVSGHKIHAPKGIGALYLSDSLYQAFQAPYLGGEQEREKRPGTENLPYALGLAAAATRLNKTMKSRDAAVRALNLRLREGLKAFPEVVINSPDNAVPEVLNFSENCIKSETMLAHLAQQQVYVSSASACGRGQPSHTLAAMGRDDHIEAVALAVPVTLQGRPGSYLFGLCGQGSLLLAGLVDTLCAQQKLRGAGFVVAVPASPEQSTLLQDKGFQKAFALRCLPREVERNLWSQAEFDSVTAKKLCELRAKYWPDTVQLPPEQMGEVLRDLYSRGATIVSSEQGYGIYFRREDTLYFVEMMAENDRAAEVLMEAAREKEVIVEKAVITVGAAQNLFLGEGTRQEYGLIRFEGEPFDVSESYMRLMMD